MLAQVKYTPQDPRQRGGTRYIDIVATLKDGGEIKCYGEENSADWNALKRLDKGEVIEVESFEKNGETFHRLTNFQLDLTLSGREHIANTSDIEDPFEVLALLDDLYEECNQDLASRDLPIEPTAENVQKLTVTAFMQVS